MEGQLKSEDQTEPVGMSGANEASLVDVHSMLLRVSQVTATISREDWILNKLSFEEMYNRELSIEDAHSKTFRWLLYDSSDEDLDKDVKDDEASEENLENEATGLENGPDGFSKLELSPSEPQSKKASNPPESRETSGVPKDDPDQLLPKEQETEARKETRLKFLNWLNSGSGVFHISGKLGSGKSTLVKFLSEEARTKEELQKWAGGKRLIFSQFFFWASGSPIQRSLEGLYRGILWETLRECPSLMRHVFPRCWDPDFDLANDKLQARPFSISELVAAFELLIRSETVFDEHKICFFIDGLDEFDGDHWKLARGLKVWSNAGDLKICVSSRPHNEFIHTFTDSTKQLQLHELTRLDIQKFVEDEFEQDEQSVSVRAQSERYSRLVQSIVEKADGVFLWVRLATREILSGLGNSYSISQLEEELQQLPEGLEAMFRKMLTSIRKPDRMRAARAFLVMINKHSFRGINRLAIVHAVIDELSDADYDATMLYHPTLDLPITWDDIEKMTRTVQDRLNSRCKGLIQIQGKELAHLEFIHRSIYEFLIMHDVKAELLQFAGPSFDPERFMCMAFLRLLKSSHRLVERNQDPESEEDSTQIKEWDRQVKFGSYFWLLEKLAQPVLVIASQTETEAYCPCLRELEVVSELILKLSACLLVTPAPAEPITIQMVGQGLMPVKFLSESNDTEAQERAWLSLCALWGARRFVLDRVSAAPDLLGPSARVDLLLLASVGALHLHPIPSDSVQQSLVVSLLERGVSPNWPLSDPSRCVPVIPSFPRSMEECQTTWTTFLQLAATIIQSQPKVLTKTSVEIACKIMGYYLEFGANPTVVLVGYQIVLPKEESKEKSSVESSAILVGPTYLDLGQLIEMWDLSDKQDLLALWNRKHQPPYTLWGRGLNFTRNFLQSKPVSRIPRIETESLRPSIFLTAMVVSESELPRVDVSQVERWARTTEGRKWLLETENPSCIETWSVRI